MRPNISRPFPVSGISDSNRYWTHESGLCATICRDSLRSGTDSGKEEWAKLRIGETQTAKQNRRKRSAKTVQTKWLQTKRFRGADRLAGLERL